MTSHNSTKPYAPERKASLNLMRYGIASPVEVAKIAGVSRQVVDYWLTSEENQGKPINWRKARHSFLSKVWRKALRD